MFVRLCSQWSILTSPFYSDYAVGRVVRLSFSFCCLYTINRALMWTTVIILVCGIIEFISRLRSCIKIFGIMIAVQLIVTQNVMWFNTMHIHGRVREPRNRPRRTHRVSGGTAQLFLNLSTRRGCVVSITPGRLYPRQRPGTHCTGGWVGPGAGLDRCGKSHPTGIRSPDLAAHSELLYRLCYPSSHKDISVYKI